MEQGSDLTSLIVQYVHWLKAIALSLSHSIEQDVYNTLINTPFPHIVFISKVKDKTENTAFLTQ